MRHGRVILAGVLVGLNAGCAAGPLTNGVGVWAGGWNRWLPAFAQARLSSVALRPYAQVIWSNDPYSRYAVFASVLSRVIPPQGVSLHVLVDRAPCGLCLNGPVLYVDPDALASWSDEEALGAVAHELAHHALGHAEHSPSTEQPSGTEPLLVSQFSDGQERAADRQATAYLDALGYDGWTLMGRRRAKCRQMTSGAWASWVARHPLEADPLDFLKRVPVLSAAARRTGGPRRVARADAPVASIARPSPLAPPAPPQALPERFDVTLTVRGSLTRINQTRDGWLQITVTDILHASVPVVITTNTRISRGGVILSAEALREQTDLEVDYRFHALTDIRYATAIHVL